VAYLDTAGHIWELSRAVGGQWTGTDLTAHVTQAPDLAAAGSALSGYDWAPGAKNLAFLDTVGHVWELTFAEGGSWTARDLTGSTTGAPAAAPGSALSAYQWVSPPGQQPAYVRAQVVYLDADGHVHELLSPVPPFGRGQPPWTHTDLTQQAGAPSAAAGSALSGYGWPTGNAKQVVFLDADSHVWELSVTPGARWSAADITQLASAPLASAGSPLSGFAWAAGAAKQVVFLDAAGHAHELLLTLPTGVGQPAWQYTDLTRQAGAPQAAAGSALCGYDWPAANSKQVCYLDADGHAWELSTTPGAPWSAADLTHLAAAPPAAGSQIAGYRTPTDLTTLYGLLRARLLSRHFALGRYFRADHLSYRNMLGTVHQAGKHVVYLDGARHVRELFLGAGGTWTGGADLTAETSAPPVAEGSPLAGCQWPRGAEFVTYLDDAWHVHLMGPGSDTGIQVDLDLHNAANPPAPPAAARSPLVAYPWSGGDADQVAYLDSAGHVHEVSGPVEAGWSDADLTELAGAQPASWGSLAGYDWLAGRSKHVAYLDDAGHVHELSIAQGGAWTAADVTAAIAPAPRRAKPASPLAGFGWPAGRSRHVIYLDSAGHVWELSCPERGSWTATDVTEAATPTPQPAAAYSPLAAYACAVGDSAIPPPPASSFDWAAANTRQVVYFDAAGHIWELSAQPGEGWVATDLTAHIGAPARAAAGSPLSGYAWAGGLMKQVLYLDERGHVREMSKPANGDWVHGVLDLTVLTGAQPAALSSPLSGYEYPGPAQNLPAHDFLWDTPGAVLVQPAPVYANAAALRTLPAEQSAFERWRVGDRDRANPLMYSGQLMTCLAVETELGIGGNSTDILSRLLATTGSLYKYQAPPNDGYILRWDPITSDHWDTAFGEAGEIWTFGCADFLVDSDRPGGWLYCTPLDDPRYVPYMPQGDFNKLSVNAQNDYQNNRQFSVDRLRYWEPSMDELTGLIAGYSFVATVTTNPAIRAQVTDQVGRLASYLSANGYLLVRPEGGFTAQGSAGIAPALEYPFGRVFNQITGDPHPARADFEGALANAKLWSQFSTPFALATAGGLVAGPVALGLLLLVPVIGPLIPTMISAAGGLIPFYRLIGGGGLARAWYLYNAREVFDVRAWPGGPSALKRNDGLQSEFALAYLLSQFDPVPRFNIALQALGSGLGGYAQNFPPYLGLTAADDNDPIVTAAYLGWLQARRDAQFNFTSPAFASAVAVTLGSGQAEQETLVSLLWQQAAAFDENGSDDLDLADNSLASNGNFTYVTEDVGSALDFMSALALAWHFAQAQADAGTPLPASLGFPAPPPAGTALPLGALPRAVAAATAGVDPEQVLGLPPLPDPIPAETDLFDATAPHKPPDSPPLTVPIHWVYVYTGAMDHSGNWWTLGDSGTDTINGGKTLTGTFCLILGVKLELVDRQGNPLGDEGTSMTPPAAPAVTGGFPSTAGAGIVPGVSYPSTDETVTVRWWYNIGRACRYRIGYLIQGQNCAL
jgi:hypothetical protein